VSIPSGEPADLQRAIEIVVGIWKQAMATAPQDRRRELEAQLARIRRRVEELQA
jgi:hypothetical protein